MEGKFDNVQDVGKKKSSQNAFNNERHNGNLSLDSNGIKHEKNGKRLALEQRSIIDWRKKIERRNSGI